MIHDFNEHEKALLRWLADNVLTARLNSGARILDASDFKAWLLEMAGEIESRVS